MEAVQDQLSVSRRKRKEEGRRLKRQRIEAAGGTRPREKGQQSQKEQKVEEAPKDNSGDSGEVKAGTAEKNRRHSADGKHREAAQQSRRSYNDSEKPHNRSDERTTNSSSRPPWKQDSHGTRRSPHQKHHQQNSHHNHNHRFGRVMEQVPCRNQPRLSTLSIALPGSVVSNCQTRELRTHLVGQIARAATIYHVDEIIIYDDKLSSDMRHNNSHNHRSYPSHRYRDHHGKRDDSHGEEKKKDKEGKEGDNEGEEQQQRPPRDETANDPHLFMARVLQYCECPQYLRRHFFPMHPSLQFAGLLPPIDAPHHARAEDHCRFREGVVLEDFKQEQHYGKTAAATKTTCLVNCGIRGRPVEINAKLQAGIRCTVELDPETAYGGDNSTAGRGRPHQPYSHNPNKVTGIIKGGLVVSPSTPRERDGTYWGYTTRLARSIQAVFDECPFRDTTTNKGYDLTIGTSERGDHMSESGNDNKTNNTASAQALRKKKDFKHALIVFGGVAGIEECIDADETMKLSGAKSSKLFDVWVNVCPYQGSRTIRTEEAVLIALARFGPMLFPAASTSAQGKQSSAPQEEQRPDNTPVTFTDESVSEESSSDESDGS